MLIRLFVNLSHRNGRQLSHIKFYFLYSKTITKENELKNIKKKPSNSVSPRQALFFIWGGPYHLLILGLQLISCALKASPPASTRDAEFQLCSGWLSRVPQVLMAEPEPIYDSLILDLYQYQSWIPAHIGSKSLNNYGDHSHLSLDAFF